MRPHAPTAIIENGFVQIPQSAPWLAEYFSAAEEVVLKRPGGLYVEWNGGLGARRFWYDGKSVTLYDPATPFYASRSASRPSGVNIAAISTALRGCRRSS